MPEIYNRYIRLLQLWVLNGKNTINLIKTNFFNQSNLDLVMYRRLKENNIVKLSALVNKVFVIWRVQEISKCKQNCVPNFRLEIDFEYVMSYF